MDSENEVQPEGLNLASFSDRVVAFSADVLLATAGYFLTLKLAFTEYPVLLNPWSGRWMALWTALFLAYQAWFAAEGRASLGKRLVGIRVTSTEGGDLSLAQSLIRSVTYLVSSVLNLGFLWSLFNPSRQCWHDLVIGSVVVEVRPRSAFQRNLVRVAAMACLSLVAGLWYWNRVMKPRYYRIMDVAYAKVGLQEIATLERLYHRRNGRYTGNLVSLAPYSVAPLRFLADMNTLLDVRSGLTIRTSPKNFTITAHAMDDARTLVALNGP